MPAVTGDHGEMLSPRINAVNTSQPASSLHTQIPSIQAVLAAAHHCLWAPRIPKNFLFPRTPPSSLHRLRLLLTQNHTLNRVPDLQLTHTASERLLILLV